MAKEELIEMNGAVTEVLPDSRYRVTLDNGHQLIAAATPSRKPISNICSIAPSTSPV